MATLDLRPLSLGEILDRTFTLYRSHLCFFSESRQSRSFWCWRCNSPSFS